MPPRTPSLFSGRSSAPTSPATDTITAHCDGGARGNPGPAGYGAEITDANGDLLAELSEFLGVRTNNFAEYSGLLATLSYALTHGHRSLRVISDSELMVKQIQGHYKVKSPDLIPLWQEARRRIAQLERFEIAHALRHKNKAADRLANEAMDRGMGRAPDSDFRGPKGDASAVEGKSGTTSAAARPGSRAGVQSLPLRAIPSSSASAAASVPADPAAHLSPTPARATHAPIVLTPDAIAAKPNAHRASPRPDPKPATTTMLRGFIRNGTVHLLGPEKLPDGIFVKVIPE